VEEEGPWLVSPESELDTSGTRCSDVSLDRIRSVDHVGRVGLDQPEVLAVHVEGVGVVIVARKNLRLAIELVVKLINPTSGGK
jgi:hypothetical protein